MLKKADFRNIDGENINIFLYKSVIIGSGCAGLNCADSLYDLGSRDIAVITNGLMLSTSINTGSDKQTYYKLSVAGDEQDSVYDMANTLYSGGCAEGYHCLTEAAMSLKCFFKLISLGVDFPQNEYGEYVGYRTDHDFRRRATSCGPLTSRFMAEALIRAVKSKNIDIIENKRAVKLIVKNNKVRGVICADTETGDISVYMAPNIVLATGGPSGIYSESVYPKCHSGSLGLAMEAGCEGVNLTEWQYGIASTDFRWNLSGSYMQVIPRFISVDCYGNVKEFLHEYIGEERYDLIFQKGYNWPFCPSKLCGKNRSSLIDIAVYKEICKGNKVYLDFTKNDSGYSPNLLGEEARGYLENSGVMDIERPIDKLIKMNERAYRLYIEKAGIDLKKEPLAISVCAQHNNGGIDCDVNYMTCIDGLYAAGECAGVFGVSRPGGTALNSTQVSSLRAAEHIVKQKRRSVCFSEADKRQTEAFIKMCKKLTSGKSELSSIMKNKRNVAEMMSKFAAFVRIDGKISFTYDYVSERIKKFYEENSVSDRTLIFEVLTLRDILISALCVLEAMKKYRDEGFISRGSFLTAENENVFENMSNIQTESDVSLLIKVKYKNGRTESRIDKVSKIPDSEQWFEKVYGEYYRNNR